jgi:hypothetical protein
MMGAVAGLLPSVRIAPVVNAGGLDAGAAERADFSGDSGV